MGKMPALLLLLGSMGAHICAGMCKSNAGWLGIASLLALGESHGPRFINVSIPQGSAILRLQPGNSID